MQTKKYRSDKLERHIFFKLQRENIQSNWDLSGGSIKVEKGKLELSIKY